MLSKVEVRLNQEEFNSLYDLARAELRSPSEQARYLLRRVLITEGLLSTSNSPGDYRPTEANDAVTH